MAKQEDVRVARVTPSMVAMFVGLLAAVAGFAVSCAAWLGLALNYTASTDTVLRGMLFGFSPGLLAVVTTTVLFYVAGWLIGYVQAGLFNWVVQSMGSVEVATKDLGEPVRMAEAAPARSGTTRRAEPTFGETIGRKDIDE